MSLEQMMHTVMEETDYLPETNASLLVSELTETETNEVVGFLAERPIHTVIMMGMIRDNELVSD